MPDQPALLFPQLAALYGAAAPWAEALLRAVTGLALVPHGLRMTLGWFPDSRPPVTSLGALARQLDATGYRPGRRGAPAIALTQLVAGPLLALGLFTRPAALPIVLFLLVSCIERWRVGGWFWNTLGLEYTLLWAVAALFFLVHGGGAYSLDRLLLAREF